jgi:hypothetical protein
MVWLASGNVGSDPVTRMTPRSFSVCQSVLTGLQKPLIGITARKRRENERNGSSPVKESKT